MEVSECSPVPYSLSDIQLPESPKRMKKCEDKNEMDHMSDDTANQNSLSSKSQSNGETVDKVHSPQKADVSETKNSNQNNDSPEKIKVRKVKRHSDESSDSESDRNSSPCKKKPFRYEETSSNLAADSDEDHHKDTLSKEQKYVKTQKHTDDSDDNKSSDSEKYNRHVDTKRSSHNKRRERKRHNRSSSSSSSKSSDSSGERRHSKKPFVAKDKNIEQHDESNQISDGSSDEKIVKNEKKDSVTESSTTTSPSIKKRLKIKRDNVPIEIPSPPKETSEKNPVNKSTEKNSSVHSASETSIKHEPPEAKEEKAEVNYKPRKVTLSSRKLNRKSSDDNGIESKSKKNKWESFASCQKSSNPVSISTGSLKDWFPDFKLVSDTSMEVEQDEHSLSAIDDKNEDSIQAETLNDTESSARKESTSQMDMEDSVSQEADFEDTVDLESVSKIIFIQNLVRPFTLNQLKDLLRQNGKIVEEYFWIDKIKSKCFVMYETEKEAVKARNALNNTRWPSSNPKILSVEFSSLEELEKHQKGNEPQTPKPLEQPPVEPTDTIEARTSHSVEEHKRKDRERRKEKERTKIQAPVREWDKDKIIQDSPERERPSKEEKSKSGEKKEKKESKKRTTEDTPAKLLDDLFQKTKSVPCIYWLPLTEEQAKAKEEEKKMRRLEREKRNQQLREQEESERRSRRARSSSRRREKENRKSSTRSRSPVSRRR